MAYCTKLYEMVNCCPGHTLVHLRYPHWISNRGSNTCSNTQIGKTKYLFNCFLAPNMSFLLAVDLLDDVKELLFNWQGWLDHLGSAGRDKLLWCM